MNTVTTEQGYAATYHFLDRLYFRHKRDDLGGLLSDMSLLPDGNPIDAAVFEDWQDAVQFALAGGEAGRLTFGPSQ
jgi:hypothetical protein